MSSFHPKSTFFSWWNQACTQTHTKTHIPREPKLAARFIEALLLIFIFHNINFLNSFVHKLIKTFPRMWIDSETCTVPWPPHLQISFFERTLNNLFVVKSLVPFRRFESLQSLRKLISNSTSVWAPPYLLVFNCALIKTGTLNLARKTTWYSFLITFSRINA